MIFFIGFYYIQFFLFYWVQRDLELLRKNKRAQESAVGRAQKTGSIAIL
jgi:hypothetical protein